MGRRVGDDDDDEEEEEGLCGGGGGEYGEGGRKPPATAHNGMADTRDLDKLDDTSYFSVCAFAKRLPDD